MVFKDFLEYSNSKDQPIAINDIDCYYIDKEFNAIKLVMKNGRKVMLRENESNKINIIKQLKQYGINDINEINKYVNDLSLEELIHICKEKDNIDKDKEDELLHNEKELRKYVLNILKNTKNWKKYNNHTSK